MSQSKLPNVGSTIAVVGATGPLGRRVVARLVADGHHVVATWRTDSASALEQLSALGAHTVQWDVTNLEAIPDAVASADGVIFTPILTVSGPAARKLLASGFDRPVILFSSNNVTIDTTAAVYRDLRREEEDLLAVSGNWVIIRPTMIYGYVGDGNLSELIKAAMDFPVMPLPGDGHAQQRPIHVDDLVDLVVKAVRQELNLQSPDIIGAAGPDACSLIELYRKVCRAAGHNVVVLPIPLFPLRWGVKLASALPIKLPVSQAQLNRIVEDKVPHTHIPDCWTGAINIDTGVQRLVTDIKRHRVEDAPLDRAPPDT